jgi:hypothetical protein
VVLSEFLMTFFLDPFISIYKIRKILNFTAVNFIYNGTRQCLFQTGFSVAQAK